MENLYTYNLTQFPNNECNIGSLEIEILENFSTLLYINQINNIVQIAFNEELSVENETLLSNIIASHELIKEELKDNQIITGDVSIGGSIYIQTDTINRDNSNFAVMDPSIGLSNSKIKFSLYGTYFHWAENTSVSLTTSSNYITKVSLTTSDLPEGIYQIQVNYGWSQSKGNSFFLSRILLDDNQLGQIHKVSPTTGDKFGNKAVDPEWMDYVHREFVTNLSGVHTIQLQWKQENGNTAKIADANIQLFRIN